ncbi:MAG: FGGY family carbohydrate kinase [Stappiaceae bacterium]
MTDPVLIGIDVGTTTVKAALFDENGKVLSRYANAYATTHGKNGFVEQDPNDWLKRIDTAFEHFTADHNLDSVRAIGLTSQVNTHVFVDENGNPLAPAIVWQDGRAAEAAASLDGEISEADRLKWWGGPMSVDASHALARMKWMQQMHPDIWQQTKWVMLPKDFCLFKLTGEAATDPISNIHLFDRELQPIPALLDLLPGAGDRILPAAQMTDIMGNVKPGRPCAGIPVAIGVMDAWAGMFGLGLHADKSALYLSGTSEILGIRSDKETPAPGVIVFPETHGIRLHAGPTQSGGAAMLWACGLLGLKPDEISRLVGELDDGVAVPLFLPHLAGERAPIWDINARGTFLGVETQTGQAELAASVFEGVAFAARWLLETLEVSAGFTPEYLNCGGGGFRSESWNRIRANILGLPLNRLAVQDPGLLGAAGLAAVAAGLEPSIEAAFSSVVRFDRTFEPNLQTRARYDEKFDLFKHAYRANSEINHALAKQI